MPMTAAERQKRYRDRLKQATQQLEGRFEQFVVELRKSYIASGINLLQLHDDEPARAALREFMGRAHADIDIARIMEDAGKSAALALYESEVAQSMAPSRKRALFGLRLRKGVAGRRRS